LIASNSSNPNRRRRHRAEPNRHVCAGVILISLLAALLLVRHLEGAPPLPNETWVVGEVVEFDAIDSASLGIAPRRTLSQLKIKLIETSAVERMANFLLGAEGQTIEVMSTEVLAPAELLGRIIKVRVTFRGDQKAQRYWMLRPITIVTPERPKP
jgi:hypothetical protein